MQIEGPGVGGPGVDVIEVTEGFVQGLKWSAPIPVPFTIQSATYSYSPVPDTGFGRLAVHATSNPGEVRHGALLAALLVVRPWLPLSCPLSQATFLPSW